MESKFINITGNIGSGATTLCQWLSKEFGWHQTLSQAHNSPFLQEFYQHKGNFAFQNQVYIILQSIRQQKELLGKVPLMCQDYTIYEHNDVYSRTMFKRGYIDSEELALLRNMFETMSEKLINPDLLVYLQVDIETLLKRIKKRNRPTEQKIDRAYLEDLQTHFDHFVKYWKVSPAVTFDATTLDLTSKSDTDTLKAKLTSHLNCT